MRRTFVASTLALALLAAGCTSGASSANEFEGEQKAVADVVEDLQSAGETGDAGKICTDIISSSLADQIKAAGASCEQELDKAIGDADDFDLEVESVEVSGDTATAEVKGREGDRDQVRTFEFERDGDSWRATSFGS
jgi:hypothetical protein